jgi:hypothetical protein
MPFILFYLGGPSQAACKRHQAFHRMPRCSKPNALIPNVVAMRIITPMPTYLLNRFSRINHALIIAKLTIPTNSPIPFLTATP